MQKKQKLAEKLHKNTKNWLKKLLSVNDIQIIVQFSIQHGKKKEIFISFNFTESYLK